MIRNLLLILLVAYSSTSTAQHYKLNTIRSAFAFQISNFGIDVDGKFTEASGSIFFDQNDPGRSTFNIVVDARSVATGITLRDNHLMKKNYFDVEQFPKMTFRSTSVRKIHGDKYEVTGLLSIKSESREISVPVEVLFAELQISFAGIFSIDRREFGIGGSSLTMGNSVQVRVNLVADLDR